MEDGGLEESPPIVFDQIEWLIFLGIFVHQTGP